MGECLSMVYVYGTVVGRRVCFGRTVLCAMGSLTFLFCCTVLDVVFAKWGKCTGSEFFYMVYVYGTLVGGRVCFGRTVLCAIASNFLVLLHCSGRCSVALLWMLLFQNGGKHPECEFLSMVYFYGSMVGGRFCFGRTVLCAMGSLTFLFCCTVVDVVFAKWGNP